MNNKEKNMDSGIIMLRFRDLVTEPGGTIIEHRSILRSYGEVWWGWWMREQEHPPRQLLAEMRDDIDAKEWIKGFLYDASRQKIYCCRISDVKVSPTRSGITSPEPERSPEYYHRGRYPAWFLLNSIEEVEFATLNLFYHSSPSNQKEDIKYSHSKGNKIEAIDSLHENGILRSLRDLRKLDVTMWVVQENIEK